MLTPYWQNPVTQLYQADARALPLPDKSVHMVVTSPPYHGLRRYGLGEWQGGDADCSHEKEREHEVSLRTSTISYAKNSGHAEEPWSNNTCGLCGAVNTPDGIGLEPTLGEWVDNIVAVMQEVKRVLRDDGTVFLNLGDSYSSGSGGLKDWAGSSNPVKGVESRQPYKELPPKNLVGQPWRVAFALQEDGWILRSAIVWHKCLSGGTRVYAKTQKGAMPMTIRELSRLDPSTVQLWTGAKWSQMRAISEVYPDESLELRFRTGQSVGCTPEHRWPTTNGITEARYLKAGDVIQTTTLPDTQHSVVSVPIKVAYVIGLYMAEGSRGKRGRQIQFSLHSKEDDLTKRIQDVANFYDAPCTVHDYENSRHVNIHSRIVEGILDTYLVGNTSKGKHLSSAAWRMSNDWLRALVEGYLAGDGHYDEPQDRWTLGFTANESWANDLRTLAARLGASVHLRWADHLNTTTGKTHKGFRGDWRFDSTQRAMPDGQIVSIQKSKGRRFYNITIDEPHVFALASGVLTHNSNPMPESVTDRPTSAYEMIFLLAKQPKYFYDGESLRADALPRWGRHSAEKYKTIKGVSDTGIHSGGYERPTTSNARNVWQIPTQGRSDSHFATFPDELPRRCILAGTSEKGVCAKCGSQWVRQTEHEYVKDPRHGGIVGRRDGDDDNSWGGNETPSLRKVVETLGWEPTCDCNAATVPATILDVFVGSGTTCAVAQSLGRRSVGIDLSPSYLDIAVKRISKVSLPMVMV